MSARPMPLEADFESPLPDFDALLARRDRPYPALCGISGAVLIVLALALGADGRVGLTVLGVGGLGAVLIVLALKLSKRRDALRAETLRRTLDAYPFETLARASSSPEVSEGSRVLIANFLNVRYPGMVFGLDACDRNTLGRPSPGGCGSGSCGGGCH